MTIAELRKTLEGLPDDHPVLVWSDHYSEEGYVPVERIEVASMKQRTSIVGSEPIEVYDRAMVPQDYGRDALLIKLF